ncbi:hypothetical protein ABD87_22585 [Lysinibacillus sphaericus]|nr:hypothetical protein [Lysinibacillus sphaericus]
MENINLRDLWVGSSIFLSLIVFVIGIIMFIIGLYFKIRKNNTSFVRNGSFIMIGSIVVLILVWYLSSKIKGGN